jgi:hypothetical protein
MTASPPVISTITISDLQFSYTRSDMNFTRQELETILESLQYSKQKISDYTGYPSYQFKQERLKEIMDVIQKIREMKKESK